MVAQVCERAAVMYAGEIVEEGPVATLFHDPRHPYTRMLFAATPDLYGDDAVLSIPGAPPRLDRELVGLPVRAALRLGLRAAAATRHPRQLEVGAGHVAALPSQRPGVRATVA